MHEEGGPPIWAAFGDLMACLFGIFVLFFSWMVLMEVSLTEELHAVEQQREEATARAEALEHALAGPLASGLITLTDGRIGIRGAVLFDLSSAELRPRGQRLLRELAVPLRRYLQERGEALMVSGFTDDLALRQGGTFADNWELSSERALTVTRTLVAAGISAESIFAAGFGPHHPVESNATEEGRALNRRVEIAPVPRPLFERLTSTHRDSSQQDDSAESSDASEDSASPTDVESTPSSLTETEMGAAEGTLRDGDDAPPETVPGGAAADSVTAESP